MIAKMFVGRWSYLSFCVLNEKYVDTRAFIIHHLVETTKMNHHNVIGIVSTITTIAQGLNNGDKFG